MNQDWLIELTKEEYQSKHHLLTIQNGYMGIKGYFSELFDNSNSTILVIGIYDQVGDKWKEIINMPCFWQNEFKVDGEKIELKDDNTEDFKVYLDMKSSKLTMEYTWKSKTGKKVQVTHERIACYDKRNMSAWKFGIKNISEKIDLSVRLGIDGDVQDANGVHLENITFDEMESGFWYNARTQQHKYEITAANRIEIECEGKKIKAEKIEKTEKYIGGVYNCVLSKGETLNTEVVGYLFTSRDCQDCKVDTLETQSKKVSFKELLDDHKKALEKQWEITDVVIEGDEKAQKYMRFNLHILITAVPKDYDYCFIPSRALSAQTYKGSIFWEVDTYAFPYFAFVFPQYAKNHMVYRYNMLSHAIKKAKDQGFEGAFYAWESLDTGEEATRKFVWTDVYSGKALRNYFGERQYHIAADVIYAVWQYYEISGDVDFILDCGIEMTLQVARFVASLVFYSKVRDRYEILHTTCPDEYHEEVRNNHFTNKMCKFAVEKALKCLEEMGDTYPEKMEQITNKIGLKESELELWADISEKMYLQKPDDNMVIEEFDGYYDLEDMTVEEFKNNLKRKDEYYGYPVGPATNTQIVKQADVIQAMVMFKDDYHPVVRKASFDYYDLRTEHGSGDSPNAYGIVAAQVGSAKDACRYFMKSAAIDLESTNSAGKAGLALGGLHTAPCGGTWQVVAYGFLGIKLEGDLIKFNPILPRHWSKVSLNINLKGEMLSITLTQDELTIVNVKGNKSTRKIKINEQPIESIEPGSKLAKPYKKIGRHYFTYEAMK